MSDDPVRAVTSWLEEHWNPDLTVGEWWELLGTSGWAAPTFPPEWYGKGISRADGARVQRAIQDVGALGPPGGLGLLLAAPTILKHGTDEQKRRYVADIVCGRKSWCQLFSEPGAGSDLAGLQATAVRDGDTWIVNGQKVWTSGAFTADLGMLVARTDPDVPKHQGLTYFLVDMHQAGFEIRPLRELTGRSLFTEVFLTDVRVHDADVLGGLGNGWAVTNSTLGFERAGLGAGSSGAAEVSATAGTVAGHLARRAGDFIRTGARKRETFSVRAEPLIAAARRYGRTADSVTRQGLAQIYTEGELGRYMALRQHAMRKVGHDVPGAANIAKLRMSHMFRLASKLGLHAVGAQGMLHDYRSSREASVLDADDPARSMTALALWAPGPSIYGGTDQIQRNILAERVLGLPREPGDDRATAFRNLPKNT